MTQSSSQTVTQSPSSDCNNPILGMVIADIHLQPNHPTHPINQHFLKFLTGVAPKAEALYILGDLFEVWLGDDIGLIQYQTELTALKRLVDSGTQVYVQYGNRDFLMRKNFSKQTGIQLLPDEYPAEIGQHKLLMVHGDQLCTLDAQYQKMRKLFRNPIIQWLFLHLPKAKRMAIGQKMRQGSQQSTQAKNHAIMDVEQASIEQLFTHYPDYNTLIHGHTHRPNLHDFAMQERDYKRYVLSDWRPQATYLQITDSTLEIIAF